MVSAFKMMTPKKRKLSAKGAKAVNHAARQNMVQEIQELETRAHGLGMHVTAHALIGTP